MSVSPPLPNDRPRILVLDRNKFRQAGIMHLIDEWAEGAGLQVAAGGPDALTRGNATHCKMVIVSVGSASVGDPQQRSLIEQVRSDMPDAPLVVLSDREEVEEICAAFQEGASGFMPTSIEPSVAFQALTFINAGGSFFPPSTLFAVAPRMQSAGPQGKFGHPSRLTTKQNEVLKLLRQGEPNKTIARQLGMSDATVKVHVRCIMRKFGVANRTQIAIAAVDSNGPAGEATNGTAARLAQPAK